MFEKAGILFLYAETPLQAGSGMGVGDVDRALQREKHTGYPFIQAAGVKGAVRDVLTARDSKHIETLFGPEPGGPPERAGVLSFTEARLLLFPVWSLRGVFAWVTCPAVLRRFREDMELVSPKVAEGLEKASRLNPGPAQGLVPDERTNLATPEGKIVLENLTLECRANTAVKQVASLLAEHAFPSASDYWTAKVQADLVVVADEYFGDFVREATEVISRVQIGDTGTVAEGPWAEERLPAETLLYGLVLVADPRLRSARPPQALRDGAAVLNYLKGHLDHASFVPIGANQSLGWGRVSLRFHPPEDFSTEAMQRWMASNP